MISLYNTTGHDMKQCAMSKVKDIVCDLLSCTRSDLIQYGYFMNGSFSDKIKNGRRLKLELEPRLMKTLVEEPFWSDLNLRLKKTFGHRLISVEQHYNDRRGPGLADLVVKVAE